MAQETGCRGDARGRARIQKGGAGWSVPVMAVLLGQQFNHGEVIAENADATLRCGALARQRDDIARPFTNRAKQIQFNGRPQSGGTLMGIQSLEDQFGRWCAAGLGSHTVFSTSCARRTIVGPSFVFRMLPFNALYPPAVPHICDKSLTPPQ